MAYDEARLPTDVPPRPVAGGNGEWARPGDERGGTPSEPSTADSEAAQGRKGRSGARRAAREIVETLLLAVVIFLAVRLVVLNFRVDGESMLPNLDDAQMLLVNRNAYLDFDLNRLRNILPGEDREETDVVYPFDPPERGDIVVFNPPVNDDEDQPYIKRVIALPGETVSFENDRVLIDGQPLDEPYIEEPTTCDGRPRNCRVTVPEGSVYVLGDNRDNSSDSRSFGPVEEDDIVGKAWFSYWPLNDLGLVPHYDYPGIEER